VSAPTLAAPTAQALAHEHPEFRGWLALLAAVGDEAAASVWADAVPEVAAATVPRLAGATLAIDRDVATAWLCRLVDLAADAAPALAGVAQRLDAFAALEAAIALDMARIDALADSAHAPREPLRAVLPLMPYPWLERCGARLVGGVGTDHAQAWCPICGAWATLAEARGLEGARRLRCGRCGGDWRAEWLRCPFCGTDEHARLRGLVGATGESRRADGCAACGAWVKTIATLGTSTVGELRLLDLATVDLDVAALERDWSRPAGLGAPLDVRVVARQAKSGSRMRRWWPR
jgi:FdhE protein